MTKKKAPSQTQGQISPSKLSNKKTAPFTPQSERKDLRSPMVRERDPDYFLYLSKDGREHTLKKKRWSSLQPPHKESAPPSTFNKKEKNKMRVPPKLFGGKRRGAFSRRELLVTLSFEENEETSLLAKQNTAPPKPSKTTSD